VTVKLHDRSTEAEQFEIHRGHLRAVAYRMLGSLAEADDAVQETWLRLRRSDSREIENLGGWLTTVVSRICLDLLRARRSRRDRETPLHEASGVSRRPGPDDELEQADEVGLALLVVLDRLDPAERVAFVLHDLFAVPFDRIAPLVDRSVPTTKKLASRARHRVHGPSPSAAEGRGVDLARHRAVVDAFLAATRGGDIEALLAVLAPDVVRRADRGALLRGARAVVEETLRSVLRARHARLALVDGRPGLVVAPRGRLVFALALTLDDGDDADRRARITEIDVISDPARLRRLDLAVLPGPAAAPIPPD
jgi:RNA polymerase sigma-70 factor (ECF subfamily)